MPLALANEVCIARVLRARARFRDKRVPSHGLPFARSTGSCRTEDCWPRLAYNPPMKFSIRDVLWLTVVVALAVCWALDRVTLMRAEQRARIEAQRAIVAEQQARENAEIARAAQAQLRSTAATPDPQADLPPAIAAP